MRKAEGFINNNYSPLLFIPRTENQILMKLPPGKLLIAIFLTLTTSCSPKMTMHTLEERVTASISKQHGVFAVAFKDLSTGQELSINDRTTFHAASTMK